MRSMNLFLRDLQAGTTTLLTPTTGGGLSQGGSMDPIFSPDGHSVAFLSYATGLTANPVGPDGPGLNLYVRDLATGTTQARQRHARRRSSPAARCLRRPSAPTAARWPTSARPPT